MISPNACSAAPTRAQETCEHQHGRQPAEIPELPSKQATDRLASLVEPYRRITAPKFYGIGSLPDDGSPCLLAFHLPGSLAAGGLPLGQRPAFLPAPGEERNQADHDLWNQRGGPPHEVRPG